MTYTDTVIRASFLRGASREELVYSNVESERLRAKAMKGLMGSGEADKSNVTLEFILAGAMQKWSLDTEGVDLTAVANATEFHSFVTKA